RGAFALAGETVHQFLIGARARRSSRGGVEGHAWNGRSGDLCAEGHDTRRGGATRDDRAASVSGALHGSDGARLPTSTHPAPTPKRTPRQSEIGAGIKPGPREAIPSEAA